MGVHSLVSVDELHIIKVQSSMFYYLKEKCAMPVSISRDVLAELELPVSVAWSRICGMDWLVTDAGEGDIQRLLEARPDPAYVGDVDPEFVIWGYNGYVVANLEGELCCFWEHDRIIYSKRSYGLHKVPGFLEVEDVSASLL